MDYIDKLTPYLQVGMDKTIFYVPKILIAGISIWIGFNVIKKLTNFTNIILQKSGMSDTIRPFMLSVVNIALKIVLVFIIAGILDIELSIFATIIAASVFAIGMALQGSLGNFASGLIVLTIRPYKMGDWIQIDDKFGRVVEIGVFNTKVITPGNKTLIIPNSKITDDVVTNYSENEMIKLELEVSIPYKESFPRVQKIISDALKPIEKILKPEETEIGIINFESHNITLAVKPFVHPDNYWEITYLSYEAIKKAFSDNGIEVAYSEGIALGRIGE